MTNSEIIGVVKRFFPMLHPYPTDKPRWLIDVGIGGGTEAQAFKDEWPDIKVIGLEPSVEMRKKTLAEGYPGEVLPIGAWSHARLIDMTRLGPQSSVFDCGLQYDGQKFDQVEVRPLDELVVDKGVHSGVVLWLDIEGAELEALRGAWKLLQSRVVLLNVEVRPTPKFWGACSEAEVDSFLASFGFAKALTYNHHTGSDPHWDAVYVPATRDKSW